MSRGVAKRISTCAVLVLAILAPGVHADEQLVPLYVFGGQADGGGPNAVIADRNGDLFGTTYFGGGGSCAAGCGTIFEISPQPDGSWKQATLYTFKGGDDGAYSLSPLALDASGALYGHTRVTAKGGTAYRLTPNDGGWTFDILYEFSGGADGVLNDYSPLLLEGKNIYGLTRTGGADGNGTLFELKPPKNGGVPWKRSTLFSFPSGGGDPVWLVKDALSDTIYVATSDGNGAVVAVSPSGKGEWTETVLYSFAGGHDGSYPFDLVVESNGTVYGLASNQIFSLTPPSGEGAWTKTNLYVAGRYGPSSITLAPKGGLVGVEFGEIDFTAGHAFKLKPPDQPGDPWQFRKIYNFNKCCLSRNPENVVYGKDRQLYGALEGGDSDFGAVFELQH